MLHLPIPRLLSSSSLHYGLRTLPHQWPLSLPIDYCIRGRIPMTNQYVIPNFNSCKQSPLRMMVLIQSVLPVSTSSLSVILYYM